MNDVQYISVIGTPRIGDPDLLTKIKMFDPIVKFSHSTISNIVIAAVYDSQIIGYLIGGIYPQTLDRLGQWEFGENRYRSFWIDYVMVGDEFRGRGIGKGLVSQAENYFHTYTHLIPTGSKSHIYLVAIDEAINFWVKMGWKIILTHDHVDNEDYPSVYANEYGHHMAKSLSGKDDKITGEELYFDKYPNNLIESYSHLFLLGAEDFPLTTYVENFNDPLNNMFDCLVRFSYNYTLESLKQVYEKLLWASDQVEDGDPHFIQNFLDPEDFEPRFSRKNPEWDQILSWVNSTFS